MSSLAEMFNKAVDYKSVGDLDSAARCYEELLKQYPDCTEACFNLASLYSDIGKVDESIKYYNKVLESNPDDTSTKYFISLCYMKNRKYSLGFPYFENRLCRASALLTQEHTYPNLIANTKLWQGEDVKDKTIYTYYEAGFGDVLMFSRYLPLLQEKCKKVIFKPQMPLYELFQENFPNMHVMRFFEPEKDIHFDYHIPILSLPYAMGLDENSMFISKSGYLKPNWDKVDYYEDNFFNNHKFKIGIKWQGNTTYDFERVIDINEFRRIMEIPNVELYSFQTEAGSERTKELGITDISPTLKSFSDTAAAIENMDLVICNDTSLAHVAGAIGKPCWVLLPYIYNWRWHQDLSKCDWYDKVKLYRQPTPKDWTSVFDRIVADLKDLIN